MSPRFVLIGPPGAGKSTIGAALARRLDTSFSDTDKVIVEKVGKSISDLFVLDGEATFRSIEQIVVADQLHTENGVLALGGGSVLNEQTQREIFLSKDTGTKVVFLDVSIAAAAPRIGFNRDRPLLLGNPRAQWLSLMQERRPIYESLANIVINTSEITPEETIDMILSLTEQI